MYRQVMIDSCEQSRRKVMMTLYGLLTDEAQLREVVGKNAILDCALYAMATANHDLMKTLNSCLSVQELKDDIGHIALDHHYIKKALEDTICEVSTQKP